MTRFVCEECEKEGGIFEFGFCKQKHPNAIKKVIGQEGTDSVLLNPTGTTYPFGKIDAEKLNDLVVFKATIMQTSDISNYDIEKTYRCVDCYEETTKVADEYRDIFDKDTIPICNHCEQAPMKLDKSKTIVGNIRKVVLQETNDESGLNPRRIEAHLTSKNVYDLQAGKDYKFEAKVWSVSYGKKDNYNRFVLDVTRVRCLDEDTSIMPTANEVELFRKIDPIKVIESLAPEIIYRTDEKMAGIISLLSGGRVDGIRGDMSVFYVGDPSTGKSQILNALHSLDKHSFKISGRSASAAGMVMGVDNLPDGTRMATFGPVILAHNHFVCIDEMDKMNETDRSMLHDVMEDEVAHLNKVGINITMPAQTKIIGAANPKKSKYDTSSTIMKNIGMPNSFLARFGYVFLLMDNFKRTQESHKIDRINFIKENGMDKFVSKNELLTTEQLIKYVNYAKSIKPEFSHGCLSKLKDLYLDLKFKDHDFGSIDIDTRAYHDIIRGAYSFARFRFSTTVEVEDVNQAWRLYTTALNSFGMKTKGEFNEMNMESRTTLEDLGGFL
jgi:DNA replicative helicase MCM subunit Mcm2 (Cdc46/Mcm family)